MTARAAALGRLLLYAAIVVLHVWLERALAPDAGELRYAWLGALFAAVAQAFVWLADKAVTIGIVVYHATVIVGRALWDFATRIAGVFRGTYTLLRNFWSSVLRPFVAWTWRQVDRLAAWLQRTFDPVLRALFRIRAELLRWYDKWLRPVFDTITAIRRILQLLSAFRLEWARALDRRLAELEDRLLAPIRFALTKINEAIDVVNRIVTLDGLLQRMTLLRSLARDVGALRAIWHNAASKPLTEEARAAARARDQFKGGEQLARESIAYLQTGVGPHAASINEWGAELLRRLRAPG